ncbi:unnamed protein product [Vicia faba]|uniref:Uncharacterized protein n=1 Tax=Vicia faba TaxID=3906 RepID=A0AAV1AGT7_VICFA|nr:unnamed protein product [Vicia faba]
MNEDAFTIISETSRLSTSQEHLLHHTSFVGDTPASQDMPSQFEPEIPISSAPILILSPPDTQEVFHTPPEAYSLSSSDVDAPYCPVNQAVDVDSVSSEFMDFGKDSELGLKNEIVAHFVLENEHAVQGDEFRVSERGISDSGESPVKKLKLGFDSLGNCLGGQQSQSDVVGVRNSEEEKLESPRNVVGGEQVNDVNNDDFCREIPMDDNSVPEENVETRVIQNAGDVNLVEGNTEIREDSGIREDPVLCVLPNSIRCLLEKSTATANGVETEKVEEKKKFSVFDVLKILSENTVEEDDDGLSMLEAAKRSGITFPRPTWWPDHMKSKIFNFDDHVKE